MLPEKLKLIESEAFAGIDAETVIIPKEVRAIDKGAFMNCLNLREVHIHCEGEGFYCSAYAFEGCSKLERVIVYNDLIDMPDHFENCNASIVSPDGRTR